MQINPAAIEVRKQALEVATDACMTSLQTTYRLLGELVAASSGMDSSLLVKVNSAQRAAAEALQAMRRTTSG